MTKEDMKRRRRENSRRIYAERKAAGLCVRCGKRKPKPMSAQCEECAEQVRLFNEKYREQHPRKLKRIKKAKKPTNFRSDRINSRTDLGEEFTAEEIRDIRESNDMNIAIAYQYGVLYDQICWIRRQPKDADLSGIKKRMPKASACGSWYPLAKPDGDVRFMCGYCERFTGWTFSEKAGITGVCLADGKPRHRCDFCTTEQYRDADNHCVMVDLKEGLGSWRCRY